MKKIIIILSFILLFFPLSKAWAQNLPIRQTLRVTPIIINATLTPGKSSEYFVKVENLLGEPLGIKTSVSPLNASDEDNGINFEASENNNFVSSITVADKEDILQPKEIKDIKLIINTSKDIKIDQGNAILFITPFVTRPLETSTPTVVGKIGVLILANVGEVNPTDAKNKTKIITAGFGFFAEKNPIKYALRVQNNYSKIISAKPFLKIKPLFGREEDFELVEKRILSLQIRRWIDEINLKQDKNIFYKATFAVSVGSGEQIIKDSFFILLPVKKIVLVIISGLTLTYILKFRKRIKKAISTLIRK